MVDNKKEAHHRSALYWIAPDQIKIVPGLNARDLTTPDNLAHIEDIAASMRADGYLDSHPLEVTTANGALELTAGHCRMAAVMLLHREGHPKAPEFVPYLPEAKGTDEIQRRANQRRSNMGKPLTPLEEGANARWMIGKGLDVSTIAKRTGRSDTYIEQLLKLQAAPADVKTMVAQREVSAGLAVKTLASEGETEGTAILKEASAKARAAGKRKVSPKEVQKAVQAKDDTKRFRIAWKVKARLLGVRIGQTEFAFSPEVWLDMAEKIAASARGQIEADAREEAFMAAKIAELDGRLATLNAKAAAILDGLGSQLPPADEPEAAL